jgi:hypothetical protein
MIGKLLLFMEFNMVLIRPIAINVIRETVCARTKISVPLSLFSFPISLRPDPRGKETPRLLPPHGKHDVPLTNDRYT